MESANLFLTVIFGLVIGVGANILTPFVLRIWGRFSADVRRREELNRDNFRQSVQYLLDNPQDELHIRVIATALNLESLMFTVLGLVLASNSQNMIQTTAAILSLIASIAAFIRARKYAPLVKAAWHKRHENHVGLDLYEL